MAPAGMQVLGSITPEYAQILTGDALIFLANLHRGVNARRIELLARRARRQKEIDAGKLPDFLAETKAIRDAAWEVAPVPQDLQDRRVEITGPTDRKMVINALNSGANMFMADFEDSSTPTWDNQLQGQINMRDAVDGTISFTSPEGKQYKLAEKPATLLVRPRGWHLNEKHIVIDGQPMSGSLFDFGLYFFHNAKVRVKKKSGIYLYLPKMESHLEARLWNEVFVFAQNELDVPQGTVKATVLIETILASFEMEEILFELREHSAGLNCGRWDYIFSCIKKFRTRKDFILADRGLVTMTSPFMRAYSLLLIKACASTSISASNTWVPGSPAPVACRSSISWRMPRRRKSRGRRSGTGSAVPTASSTTAARSARNCSARSCRRNWPKSGRFWATKVTRQANTRKARTCSRNSRSLRSSSNSSPCPRTNTSPRTNTADLSGPPHRRPAPLPCQGSSSSTSPTA